MIARAFNGSDSSGEGDKKNDFLAKLGTLTRKIEAYKKYFFHRQPAYHFTKKLDEIGKGPKTGPKK